MIPFDPLFRNGHVATIISVGIRAQLDEQRFPPDDRLFATENGVQVRVVSQYPEGSPRGHIVLVHGLEGSSDGSYMRGLAQSALLAGFAAHRMNMRNCGGTEAYCRTLYHSGLTIDIELFLRHLASQPGPTIPIYLVGFSLGGNQVSKLAGVLGRDAADLLAGVVAVSTPIDLEFCSRCVQKPSNWLYQWQFVVRMKRTIRRKHALMPDLISLNGIDRIRTIWALDDAYIAPFAGFRDAAHYYSVESAQNYLGDVRIPMMMVHAENDPFIPISIYDQPAVTGNPNIRFFPVPYGGHMGFIARERPHFWLNELILQWIGELEKSTHRSFSTASAD
ncbi:MAG: alpha/beta fold hydrolase [Bryobacterales bacterium]|nr:alpha/beta fold hydrolase [Bryobacterales bacterium]